MDKDISVLQNTYLPLPLFSRGKVRDTYDLGNQLLVVATDRISAFDYVLPNGIPDKGLVLNQLSLFWFRKTSQIIPNHLLEVIDNVRSLDTYVHEEKRFPYPPYLVGRSMVVNKAKRIPIECVVRGYLAGSAWEEYKQNGTICGSKMQSGLQQSQKLPHTMFTPTTKAESGHDQPMSIDEVQRMAGDSIGRQLEEKSIAIYEFAREYALTKGIIIADTKMEFGMVEDKLILIDELLTPDSSRLWDAASYSVGRDQPSFDKQPVRDWLVQSGWNKEPPVPALPQDVVDATTRRYRQAYEKLTERKLK